MTKTPAVEACLTGLAAAKSPVGGFWRTLRQRLVKTRCRLIHRSISHPIHGKYRCWTCLIEFNIDW
jgi:hypothetical protein